MPRTTVRLAGSTLSGNTLLIEMKVKDLFQDQELDLMQTYLLIPLGYLHSQQRYTTKIHWAVGECVLCTVTYIHAKYYNIYSELKGVPFSLFGFGFLFCFLIVNYFSGALWVNFRVYTSTKDRAQGKHNWLLLLSLRKVVRSGEAG